MSKEKETKYLLWIYNGVIEDQTVCCLPLLFYTDGDVVSTPMEIAKLLKNVVIEGCKAEQIELKALNQKPCCKEVLKMGGADKFSYCPTCGSPLKSIPFDNEIAAVWFRLLLGRTIDGFAYNFDHLLEANGFQIWGEMTIKDIDYFYIYLGFEQFIEEDDFYEGNGSDWYIMEKVK
jgi:hypothetical protein